MILFPDTKMKGIVVHKVGNKTREEGVNISNASFSPTGDLENILMNYFLSSFRSNELFNLFHENSLDLNMIYAIASYIFDDPETLFDQSINVANHLYSESIHPKIKAGELYVCYFENVIFDEEECNAIGIFKSESKEPYLNVSITSHNFLSIKNEYGINANKLDKGCLILNTEKDRGFVVAIVDNTSKSGDAIYWKDEFLKVTPRNDDFFQTKQLIKLCKEFVTEKLPTEFEAGKADQAELLNRSMEFFKKNEQFDIKDFQNEVIKQPELIESFEDFKGVFEANNDIVIQDSFFIESDAVKNQAKAMKSIIKLDKNFHIYIHGGRERITKGVDEATGLNFYKIFYQEEK